MTEKHIGASSVIGVLKEMQKEFGECQRAFGKTAICVLEEAINKLQLLPAADVEPVVHAHWIKKSHEWDFSPYFYTDFTCSNCDVREQGPAPYCRYCGAKMDEIQLAAKERKAGWNYEIEASDVIEKE